MSHRREAMLGGASATRPAATSSAPTPQPSSRGERNGFQAAKLESGRVASLGRDPRLRRRGGALYPDRVMCTVATIGVYDWTLDAFLDALNDADAGLLVDVRQR